MLLLCQDPLSITNVLDRLYSAETRGDRSGNWNNETTSSTPTKSSDGQHSRLCGTSLASLDARAQLS